MDVNDIMHRKRAEDFGKKKKKKKKKKVGSLAGRLMTQQKHINLRCLLNAKSYIMYFLLNISINLTFLVM